MRARPRHSTGIGCCQLWILWSLAVGGALHACAHCGKGLAFRRGHVLKMQGALVPPLVSCDLFPVGF